jgi:hypothetical protein
MNIYTFDLLNIKDVYGLDIIMGHHKCRFYDDIVRLYYHGITIYLYIYDNMLEVCDTVEDKIVCIYSHISKKEFEIFWNRYRDSRKTIEYTVFTDYEYIDRFFTLLKTIEMSDREYIIKRFKLK